MGYILNNSIEHRTKLKRGSKRMKRTAMKRSGPIKKKREPPALTRAKRIARERDNYTCQYPGCDVQFKYIDVHHKGKRSQRPDLKFDPANLICLCRLHHRGTDTRRAEAIALGLLETETYELAKKKERGRVKPEPTLREMFDEWFISLPVERGPMRDSPTYDLLIDAWIAGFAKHNAITCAAQRPRSKKQKAEDELRRSDLTAQIVGRDDIEWGHHDSLPRGEHVANARTLGKPERKE